MLEQSQKEYFKELLNSVLKEAILGKREGNKENIELADHADPSDRATAELEINFNLRMRERNKGLVRKIEQALERIDKLAAIAKMTALCFFSSSILKRAGISTSFPPTVYFDEYAFLTSLAEEITVEAVKDSRNLLYLIGSLAVSGKTSNMVRAL